MLGIQKNTLSNGVRLLTVPQHESQAMTLLFLVGAGSRYETQRLNGISHFLEHILFKGTEKYPSPQALAEVLDGIGANFNAYTGEEYTGFYVHAAAKHFPLALEVLTEMFYKPRYAPDDIEREKGVVIEEINMYHDLPQRHVFDLLKFLMYGDTPIGRNIAGSKETVNAFGREDFAGYQDAFYTPDNIIVSLAGNPLDHDWSSMLKTAFGERKGTKERNFEPAQLNQSRPRAAIENRPTDQTHIALALPTIQMTDKRRYVQLVLNNILGGSMSSRLFNEIREKRGLAYYVHSGDDTYQDAGSIVVSTGARNASAKEAVEVILTELKRLREEHVTDAELQRAKDHFAGRMALSLEDSSEVAGMMASQELHYGRQLQPEELIELVNAVTADQVQEFAAEFFVRETLNLAAVGPFKEDDFLPLLERAF